MVQLTATPTVVRALSKAEEIAPEEFAKLQQPSEPSLSEHKVGTAISHSQLIDLSRLLKKHASDKSAEDGVGPPAYSLESLLKGTTIYVPPPPPKKDPSPEYKALMARLRVEEEARAYERMINPPPLSETFAQRFPNAHFSVGADYTVGEDDVSYEEVHRQIVLIINVLVSIIACAIFIWVAARHWSAPLRLGLSMGGSGAVAIAEVVVYSGYVRRARDAKLKEKKKPEIKKIVESWVIDKREKDHVVRSSGKQAADDSIRYRKGKHR